MKKCVICKSEKNESEFSKNKSRKDGLQNTCKSCMKEYRQKNKDKILEYYQKNKDKILEHHKEYKRNRRQIDSNFKITGNLR